jgi:hypothetical protein
MSNDTDTSEQTGVSTADEQPDGFEADASDGDTDIFGYVQWGVFTVLVVLAVVATFQFYTNASRAIRIWAAHDWEPVFLMAFNLLMLLASGLGVSILARRLTR